MAPLLHRAAIIRKKLQGKNIMAPLLHRAAIIRKKLQGKNIMVCPIT